MDLLQSLIIVLIHFFIAPQSAFSIAFYLNFLDTNI